MSNDRFTASDREEVNGYVKTLHIYSRGPGDAPGHQWVWTCVECASRLGQPHASDCSRGVERGPTPQEDVIEIGADGIVLKPIKEWICSDCDGTNGGCVQCADARRDGFTIRQPVPAETRPERTASLEPNIPTLSIIDMHEIARTNDTQRLGEAYVALKTAAASELSKLRAQLAQVTQELTEAKWELSWVDWILNRPALDDIKGRWEKVEHACNTANRSTEQLRAALSVIEAMAWEARERESRWSTVLKKAQGEECADPENCVETRWVCTRCFITGLALLDAPASAEREREGQ